MFAPRLLLVELLFVLGNALLVLLLRTLADSAPRLPTISARQLVWVVRQSLDLCELASLGDVPFVRGCKHAVELQCLSEDPVDLVEHGLVSLDLLATRNEIGFFNIVLLITPKLLETLN